MSVEGMWAVYFGDFGGQQVNSGVAVMETGRVFGGDSMMAYLGSYQVNGGKLTGEIKVWAFNPHQVVTTAFGKLGTPEGSMVRLEGDFDGSGNEITGLLWETDSPQLKIPAKLVKVAELPN